MPLIAITLVTIAAVIHAFWNLLGKRQNPSAAFFLIASLAAVVVLFPLAILRGRGLLAAIPAAAWALIAASCVFEALYYTALAGSYRHGDMSLAYPLARALPTVFITICTTILALGKPLTPQGLLGIALVTVGCLILPIRNWRAIGRRDYLNVCCALAVVAAVGTTGYTIIDSEALRVLRALPDSGASGSEITLLYLWLTSAGIVALLAPYVAIYPAERLRLRQLARNGWRSAVLTGLTITVGYAMVLTAMAYASNVSYIGAFRQTSIPLGAALGIVVQKEPLYAAKIAGTAVVLAGLVLVALA